MDEASRSIRYGQTPEVTARGGLRLLTQCVKCEYFYVRDPDGERALMGHRLSEEQLAMAKRRFAVTDMYRVPRVLCIYCSLEYGGLYFADVHFNAAGERLGYGLLFESIDGKAFAAIVYHAHVPVTPPLRSELAPPGPVQAVVEGLIDTPESLDIMAVETDWSKPPDAPAWTTLDGSWTPPAPLLAAAASQVWGGISFYTPFAPLGTLARITLAHTTDPDALNSMEPDELLHRWQARACDFLTVLTAYDMQPPPQYGPSAEIDYDRFFKNRDTNKRQDQDRDHDTDQDE